MLKKYISTKRIGTSLRLLMSLLLILLYTQSGIHLISSARSDPCIDAMTYVIDADFNTSRSLIDYHENLSPKFQRKLYELTSSDLWIDAGSGKSFAIRQYIETYKNPANVLGINVTNFKEETILKEILDFEKSHPKKFKMIHGKFIEDIESKNLQDATLITDLFGPFSYTNDITKILTLYLNALTIHGEAYIKFSTAKNIFMDSNKKEIELIQYLSEHTEGYAIDFPNQLWGGTPFNNPATAPKIQNTFRIVKNSNQFKVPNLKAINFRTGSPPVRKFILTP